MHSNQPTRIVGGFSEDIETAIVIPTYNEAGNLPAMCHELLALDIPAPGIVIVDDNSPDGTGAIADDIASEQRGRFAVLHRAGKQGLGTAYVEGFQHAMRTRVSQVVQMDCYFSHPPALVPVLLRRLVDADVVVGSRYCEGGAVDPRWSNQRAMLSRYANMGIRAVLGLKVQDPTSGFKAYRRTALEAIDLNALEIVGFGFQSEVAFRMQEAGVIAVEQPYTFMERTTGQSKMSAGIAVEALWRLAKLRLVA